MDSATRNILGLVGISAALAAYPVCGFVAYVLVPLLALSPSTLAHLGPVCLLPAVALTASIGASAGLAARTLGRQMSASRRLSRRVRALALPPPPELLVEAKATGLDGRVAMLDSPEQFSFVYGLLVPRVAIGRGFLKSLTAEELRAALEHERYHVRHLDPLRALLGKTLTVGFFLLPSLEVLRLRYEAGRELAADRSAEQACGRRPLLGALLKALEEPDRDAIIRASLADPGLLDARISRLETGRAPALAPVGIPSLFTSALGAASFLLLFIAAVVGLGGTSALAGMAADELSASGTLLGALCAAPVIAVGGLAYWRLMRWAGKPLPPGSRI
ncbi:MAG TPA: M56 family metallopeptidase [Solirubrobacterales bacterium]|jgi:Zn-dependent protease with chaperone function|nr:M56 family metallopeptidase [Solirubrobacterales bacterium]